MIKGRRVARLISGLIGLYGMAAAVSAAEGPRAFFGWVTHYDTSSSGRGEVLVRQIVPKGPAERAGLLPGDRVVAFNGVDFSFANEYEYMRALGVFESGRKLRLTLLRKGQEREAELVPEAISSEQAGALASYMQQLETCTRAGQNCPCPLSHLGEKSVEDFRSPYRQFSDKIWKEGRRTLLRVERDSEGQLHFSSSPVSLPSGFEISPDDDGMLWQNIYVLGKGKSFEVEIKATGPETSRLRILSP